MQRDTRTHNAKRCKEKRKEEKRVTFGVNKSGGRKVGSIPGRIGRNSRVVALRRMSGNIAGRRLWGFNIRAHVHGDPRAAKHHPSPVQLIQCLLIDTNRGADSFYRASLSIKTNDNNKPIFLLLARKKKKRKRKEKERKTRKINSPSPLPRALNIEIRRFPIPLLKEILPKVYIY